MSPNNTAVWTRAKKQAFLEALAKTGTITAAAQLAEIDRVTHYRWIKRDAKYALAFADAQEQFADRVRHEVARRALTGITKEIRYQGQVVGQEQEYSDRLLELLAKAKCTEFREKHEVSGPDGRPIQTDATLRIEFVESSAPDASDSAKS